MDTGRPCSRVVLFPPGERERWMPPSELWRVVVGMRVVAEFATEDAARAWAGID